jgi:putative ABC transport system permease protein
MLKLHLKIAWRNILRHKAFSVISVAGLSLSTAFCLLLYTYVRYETSFDRFHEKSSRLFRLEMTNFWNLEPQSKNNSVFSFLTRNEDAANLLYFPYPVGPELMQSFPEIQNLDRIQLAAPLFVRVGNHTFKETKFLYSDTSFFSMFSFRLLSGNVANSLQNPNDVVLSLSTARKYFGTDNPVGRLLSVRTDTTRLFTVSGVVEDAPANSSLQFDLIFPNVASPEYVYNAKARVADLSHLVIVELRSGASPEAFAVKLNDWQRVHFSRPLEKGFGKDFKDFDFSKLNWYTRPFASAHYNSSDPWGHHTNLNSIFVLACIALVILFIASLNYVLLAVANASSRLQEVGIRKVMGAERFQLMIQFWLETQLIILFACLLGVILCWLLTPLFNLLLGAGLPPGISQMKWALIPLPLFCFCLALFACLYPALIVSRVDPVVSIKKFGTFRINPKFGKGMVVFQFTSCIVLLCAAIIIHRQMKYVSNLDLGFKKDGVLMVHNQSFDLDFIKKMETRFETFTASHSFIAGYSPILGGLDGQPGMINIFPINGKQYPVTLLGVGYDYFDLLSIPLDQGRLFSRSFRNDTSQTAPVCVVNETLFRMLGKKARLGVFNTDLHSTVVGVVKDYHFDRLNNKIQPLQHILDNGGNISYFLFKVRGGHMQQAIGSLRDEWTSSTRAFPYEYTFLDQSIAGMYDEESRWQKTVQIACLFAVLISCMGLFGLSGLTVANYKKDVGIRKILGASLNQILYYLTRNFLLMVALSLVIACPIALYIMRRWLDGFAYRTTIDPWLFVEVGAIAFSVAALSIGYHVIKAALVSPVKSLRTD